jgi:oligopeptide transport system substrate-binding protein
MKHLPRTLLLFSLVGFVALLGVACTGEPADGGGSSSGGSRSGTSAASANSKDRFFRYNIGAAPRSLDPGKATEIPASVVIKNTFEGLTRPVPSGEVEPAAAASWEISDDGRVYTFHLREDGRWSNGDPVTARDFYESWMRVLDPDFIAEYAYAMYMIDGAQAYKETAEVGDARPSRETVGLRVIDDLTFEVKLVASTPYLLSFLDHSCFLPVHESARGADDSWATKAATYISNGPYMMTKFEPGQEIVVERNPHFREFNDIRLKGLSFRMIENANTALTEFRTGGLDGIHSDLDPADIPMLREEGILRSGPELSTYFVCFQTERAPFDNINARKAFALAINRQQLAETMNTGDRASTTFVPPGLKLSDGRDFRDAYPAPWEDNQPDAARAALKDAGYADPASFPSVTYLYNTTNRHKLVAEFLQYTWRIRSSRC